MKRRRYVCFFVSYLPEFHYQPLKLSNVRPTDFANSKHTLTYILAKEKIMSCN